MEENLHFPPCKTRIQVLQFFYLLLVLIPKFLPSIHLLFHLSLSHDLVHELTFWGTAMPLLRRSKNHADNSVWLRGKTSEAQRTSSKRGKKQAPEMEWNFSVFSTPRVTRKDKMQFTTASYRNFSYSLFIKIILNKYSQTE